jgi:hypothetical protein
MAGDWDFPAQPQRAAGGPGPGADPVTQGQLQKEVAVALARLEAAGVDPALVGRLAAADYRVGPLPAGLLGLTWAGGGRVVVSPDAAGFGWYVDATPAGDGAFGARGAGGALVAVPGGAAAGRMDLLTVVLHEMAHLAGRPSEGGAATGGDLMAEFLAPGVRRTQALDAVFSQAALTL